MSRLGQKIQCSAEDLKALKIWSNSGRQQKRLVDRAQIILLSVEAVPGVTIASRLRIRPTTVSKWRKRYLENGLAGLYDAPRSGRRPSYIVGGTSQALLNIREEDRETLKAWSNGERQPKRLIDRARIILLSAEGVPGVTIASRLMIQPGTVSKWRNRYKAQGLAGLYDAPRSGTPAVYNPDQTRRAILETVEKPAPPGQTAWDGKSIAKKLGISSHKVWRVLRNEGISLQRQSR